MKEREREREKQPYFLILDLFCTAQFVSEYLKRKGKECTITEAANKYCVIEESNLTITLIIQLL